MILLIDNYDSFVYNLGRYIGRLGRERMVVRNDAITIDEIRALSPDAIILSPGPCGPEDAGICNDVLRAFGARIPVLGVCLGHQCIGAVYGGKVTRAPQPVHGKAAAVRHDGTGLFTGLPDPLAAARYHSLIVDIESNHPALRVTARTDDGIIMGLQHLTHPVYGVQFHPESVLTEGGMEIMANFIAIADEWNGRQRGAA